MTATTSPSSAKPRRPERAAFGSSPTRPTTGVGKIGPGARLVVERDVAADDRDRERAAGVREAGDRARELPGDVGLLRVAEVEAVGEPERLGADAGEVGAALEHGLDGAAVGVAGDPPPVAVDRDRDRRAAGQLRARRRRPPPAGARCASRRGSRTARTPSAGRRGWRSRAARAAARPGRRAAPARAPAAGTSTRSARPARGRRPGTRRPAR